MKKFWYLLSVQKFYRVVHFSDLKDCRISEGSERFSSQFEDFCYDYDEHYDEPDSKRNSQMFPDNALFQPIQDEPREK